MTGSSLQQLIDCLKSLPFRELDSAVVDALWNGQLDDEGLDELKLLTNDHSSTMETLVSSLTSFNTLDNDDDVNISSFVAVQRALQEMDIGDDITFRELACILYGIIVKGSVDSFNAAVAYLMILMSPGAATIVYHHMCLRMSLSLLREWPSVAVAPKRKKAAASKQTEDLDGNIAEHDGEEERDTEKQAVPLPHFSAVLSATVDVVKNFSYSMSPDMIPFTSELICEVIAKTSDEVDLRHAYAVLRNLLLTIHGIVNENALHVFKYLLPLLLVGGNAKGLVTNASKNASSGHKMQKMALDFVISCVVDIGAQVYEAAQVLLQHMCIYVGDRLESRSSVAKMVVTLTRALVSQMGIYPYARFVRFLLLLARQSKALLRSMACEIALEFALHPDTDMGIVCHTVVNDDDDELPGHIDIPELKSPEIIQYLGSKPLLAVLLSRTTDITPTVRARACTCLSVLLEHSMELKETDNGSAFSFVNEMNDDDAVSTGPSVRSANVDVIDASKRKVLTAFAHWTGMFPINTANLLKSRTFDDKTREILTILAKPLRSADIFLELIRQRVSDSKALVRRAALQLFSNIVTMVLMYRYRGGVITTVDPISLKDLSLLELHCRDTALGTRKQCITSLSELVTKVPNAVIVYNSFVHGVLPLVTDNEQSVAQHAVDAVFDVILKPMIDLESAWSRAMERSRTSDALSALNTDTSMTTMKWLLERLCGLTGPCEAYLSHAAAVLLRQRSSAEIKVVINALERLITILKPLTDPRFVTYSTSIWMLLSLFSRHDKNIVHLPWFKEIWAECTNDHHLTEYMICILGDLKNAVSSDSADYLISRLNGLALDERMSRAAIEALLEHSGTDSSWASKIFNHLMTQVGRMTPDMTTPFVRAVFVIGELSVFLPLGVPSSLTTDLLQVLVSCSDDIKSQVFVSLAKLCLHDANLAKRLIPALIRELETNKNVTVRNNVMVILSDLCIRYTSYIDPYVIKMASSLSDADSGQRHHALTLLTRLLQEDYIKWRSDLFFRFLVTCVDSNLVVKKHARFCVCDLLLKRRPELFSANFVESIFYLNGCTNHSRYNKFPAVGPVLSGDVNASRRMELYVMMMGKMTEEQKFELAARITKDVLGGIIETTYALHDGVLYDALHILSCSSIKIKQKGQQLSAQEIAELGEDAAEAFVQSSKEKIISAMAKKTAMEHTIPVVLELKRLLEKDRSPLMKQLCLYMTELFRDYRPELQDVLASDHTTLAELEFDASRFSGHNSGVRPTPSRTVQRMATAPPSITGIMLATPLKMVSRTPAKTPGRTPGSARPMPGMTPMGPPPPGTAARYAKAKESTTKPVAENSPFRKDLEQQSPVRKLRMDSPNKFSTPKSARQQPAVQRDDDDAEAQIQLDPLTKKTKQWKITATLPPSSKHDAEDPEDPEHPDKHVRILTDDVATQEYKPVEVQADQPEIKEPEPEREPELAPPLPEARDDDDDVLIPVKKKAAPNKNKNKRQDEQRTRQVYQSPFAHDSRLDDVVIPVDSDLPDLTANKKKGRNTRKALFA